MMAFFHILLSLWKKLGKSIAKQTLNLVVQYWDTQRTVNTTGADGGFDVLMLKGSDLRNSTDIRMEGGSSLPTSKAAKQAFIMDMMKMGFIDPNEGLKLLEMGGVDKLYERIKLDESQAQRENVKLKKADPMVLQQFQDAQKQSIMMQTQTQDRKLILLVVSLCRHSRSQWSLLFQSIVGIIMIFMLQRIMLSVRPKSLNFSLTQIKSEFEVSRKYAPSQQLVAHLCKCNKHKWRDNLCRQINHKWGHKLIALFLGAKCLHQIKWEEHLMANSLNARPRCELWFLVQIFGG
jgi:hypothetical protein